ncbi:MAG: efflux RND transporter periplasmic adaptor subunit [Chloroflexota bacterium]
MDSKESELAARKLVKESWKPPETRKRRPRKLILVAFALVALLGVLYVAGFLGGREPEEPQQPVTEALPSVVSASGPVVPAKRAALSFTTTGRVSKISVQPGDKVNEGQLLAQLEPSTVQSTSYGAASPAPGTPDFYLVAPFDGVVGLVPVREWETVVPGTAVVMLGDLSHLRIEIEDLSEADVGRLQEGQSVDVTFEAFPGRKVSGRVERISPMNNTKSGGVNYDVVVEFTSADLPDLRWGMTAHVDIIVGPEH